MEGAPQNQEDKPITLERATPADLEIFMALEQSVYDPKTYPSTPDKQKALAELMDTRTYLIRKNGQIVGNIAYEMKAKDCAEITGLMVSPRYQRHGIGNEALAAVLDKLKGVKRIELVTHPENQGAPKLYKLAGFEVEARIENYYGDGEPRLLLAKTN